MFEERFATYDRCRPETSAEKVIVVFYILLFILKTTVDI